MLGTILLHCPKSIGMDVQIVLRKVQVGFYNALLRGYLSNSATETFRDEENLRRLNVALRLCHLRTERITPKKTFIRGIGISLVDNDTDGKIATECIAEMAEWTERPLPTSRAHFIQLEPISSMPCDDIDIEFSQIGEAIDHIR